MRENYSFKEAIRIALILVVAISTGHAQTITVKGKVTTSTGPVRFASVTFVEVNNILRKLTEFTDGQGSHKVEIIASLGRATILQRDLRRTY